MQSVLRGPTDHKPAHGAVAAQLGVRAATVYRLWEKVTRQNPVLPPESLMIAKPIAEFGLMTAELRSSACP